MNKKIKIVSWNVNGYRAIIKKGFFDIFRKINADIFTIQEIKIQQDQLFPSMKHIEGYESAFSFSSIKKGYSGVAVYTNIIPKSVTKGIGIQNFDNEGRLVQINFCDFIFFGVYFPNGRMNSDRLEYKLNFYESFFDYVEKYRNQGFSIVIAGDFNTAHNSIDLKNPKSNSKKSGYLSIERKWIDKIIDRGYVDTFRFLYPDVTKYTWWSYRNSSRKNNSGWRIDYCFVSRDIIDRNCLEDAFIYNKILGSDHCPIGIILNI